MSGFGCTDISYLFFKINLLTVRKLSPASSGQIIGDHLSYILCCRWNCDSDIINFLLGFESIQLSWIKINPHFPESPSVTSTSTSSWIPVRNQLQRLEWIPNSFCSLVSKCVQPFCVSLVIVHNPHLWTATSQR